MALITLADIKDDLRVESDAEDGTINRHLEGAIARVKAFAAQRDTLIGVAERTFTQVMSYRDTRGYSVLLLPMWPVLESSPAPVITDSDGAVVSSSDYTLNARFGRFTGISGFHFSTTTPYSITATVGLEAIEEYAGEIEPVINTAIRDIVADLYQHRNPSSLSESTAGVSVSYGNGSNGMPDRVLFMLDDVLPRRLWIA